MTNKPSWKMGEGHDAFCNQAMGRWDGGCQCEFLAKVRADERKQAGQRVESLRGASGVTLSMAAAVASGNNDAGVGW